MANSTVHTVRVWIQRRSVKGIAVSADDLWGYIRGLRPNWSERASSRTSFSGVL